MVTKPKKPKPVFVVFDRADSLWGSYECRSDARTAIGWFGLCEGGKVVKYVPSQALEEIAANDDPGYVAHVTARRALRGVPMTKPKRYDYIRALFGGASDAAFKYPPTARAILRKLVREAATKAVMEACAGAGCNGKESPKQTGDRIAKELVP